MDNACTSDFQITSTLLCMNRSSKWYPVETDDSLSSFDPAPLSYHHQRLLESAKAFGWQLVYERLEHPSSLAEFTKSLRQHLHGKWPEPLPRNIRMRVCVSSNGQMTIESQLMESTPTSTELNQFSLPDDLIPNSARVTCTVYTSDAVLEPSNFTRHKTTKRDHYDEIRNAAGISHLPPTKAEVLICNTKHELMEASLCTIYLVRGGTVVTPHATCGGNQGVTRRIALQDQRCCEAIVPISQLVEGEVVWLSNAVRGFWPARILLRTKHEG